MWKEIIFGLLGGLGLFLYGMQLMSDGLEKAAGDRMRKILGALTSSTVKGVLVGTVVTAVIQSSSATTVMLVSFVNAGLMTLKQAVGVIMGANIGTTITAQLIAFDLAAYALPAVGLGFLLFFFAKKEAWKNTGEIILGFGILFLGMTVLTGAVKPLRTSPVFVHWMTSFAAQPLLGVAVGAVITMIIQSSSATTGILLAVASQGLISLDAALYVLFGCNIGTCITAMLASIGTNITAKRTALAHVLFNLFGAVIFMLLFPWFKQLVLFTTHTLMRTTELTRTVANAHTLFNVTNTLIWIPLAGALVAMATKIFPGKEEEEAEGPKYLDRRMLGTPSVALDLALKEIVRTSRIAREMIEKSQLVFLEGEDLGKEIDKLEDQVDELQREITIYLSMILSQNVLAEHHSTLLAGLMHVIGDIERIGDHAENISKYGQERKAKGVDFSDAAKAELEDYFQRILTIFAQSVQALADTDRELADEVWREEEEIDALQESLRRNHLDRLCEGHCEPLAGIIFVEVVNNLERIADHATNIAEVVVEKSSVLNNLLLEVAAEN
ncbi:MAG TPA: Na/Pi cotransporter family protein [Bacillota bacterium]|nr:Na/Pi cotransporter family protein [Bacillota bacterium]